MGGPFWHYILTPQKGDQVLAWICRTCGKRRKWTMVTATVVTRHTKGNISCSEALEAGKVGWRLQTKRLHLRVTREEENTCCSTKPERVLCRVVRSAWSTFKHGTPKNFFLVLRRRDTSKVHWATLSTCEVIDSIAALAWLAKDVDDAGTGLLRGQRQAQES